MKGWGGSKTVGRGMKWGVRGVGFGNGFGRFERVGSGWVRNVKRLEWLGLKRLDLVWNSISRVGFGRL